MKAIRSFFVVLCFLVGVTGCQHKPPQRIDSFQSFFEDADTWEDIEVLLDQLGCEYDRGFLTRPLPPSGVRSLTVNLCRDRVGSRIVFRMDGKGQLTSPVEVLPCGGRGSAREELDRGQPSRINNSSSDDSNEHPD